MAKANNHSRNITIVLSVVATVIVAASLIFYFGHKASQPSYFNGNELKVVEIDTSTGPVSPQYQQSQSLILTPTTCNYTITKFAEGNKPQIVTCDMSQSTWDKIAKVYDSDGVQALLKSVPADSGSIGGPANSISVTLADGTQIKASITPQLKSQLEGFLSSLAQAVPEANQLKYSN